MKLEFKERHMDGDWVEMYNIFALKDSDKREMDQEICLRKEGDPRLWKRFQYRIKTDDSRYVYLN